VIWSYYYKPSGLPVLAKIDDGILFLGEGTLLCDSKGGNAGAEDIQCTRRGYISPVIQRFKGVSKLGTHSAVDDSEDEGRELQRELVEHDMTTRSLLIEERITLVCIKSDAEVCQWMSLFFC
jgi:hypothetical protein